MSDKKDPVAAVAKAGLDIARLSLLRTFGFMAIISLVMLFAGFLFGRYGAPAPKPASQIVLERATDRAVDKTVEATKPQLIHRAAKLKAKVYKTICVAVQEEVCLIADYCVRDKNKCTLKVCPKKGDCTEFTGTFRHKIVKNIPQAIELASASLYVGVCQDLRTVQSPKE